MKMTCIIVDDEPNARDVIKRYVEKIDWLELAGDFKDPLKALDYIRDYSIDLIFLDINMPGLNGVDFVKSLQSKPQIIFTTAYSEFALEGFENDVSDYLLKPIRFDRFQKALSKLKRGKQIVKEAGDFLMVKSGHSFHKILIANISYLRKDSNYIELHTTDKKKVLIRENMNNVFNIFPENGFIRVHKSFVIPVDKIKIIDANRITLLSDEVVPLGSSYRDDVMKRFSILR